jgi:hypothetical protein
MPVTFPAPLPADLDALARRDLVAIAEERGMEVYRRDTAESLCIRLRDLVRDQTTAARYKNVSEVREAHRAKVAHVEPSEAAQVIRDSLWGLANLFGRVQGEADTLVYTVENAIPVLLAYLNGDERVDRQTVLNEVSSLQHEVARVRESRVIAEKYAGFTMDDTADRVNAIRARHVRKPSAK